MAMEPTAGRPTRYYSESEVAVHNVYYDAWVSLFGKVLDITDLISDHLGTPLSALTAPLVRFAGQDITHWFDSRTLGPKTHISPVSWLEEPFTPYGRFLHIPPGAPVSTWSTNFMVPWWQDEQYIIGALTIKSRNLRVVNMLTQDMHVFEVCAEETLNEIQRRYLAFNSHAASYTWKRLGRVLDLEKTLDGNGIYDDSEELAVLSINQEHHLPCLQLYYNDDLTVA